MLVKVANEETKQVQIFSGSDTIWAKSIGYSEQEVEQAYDGNWYLVGYAPVKPIPTIEEQNEVIRQTRQQAYTETSDPLKQDYDEALARGEETAEEKKQLWLSAKDKIREENPYIIQTLEIVEEKDAGRGQQL